MTAPAAPGQALQAKSEITYKPFGSEDDVKLSLSIIKNYIATQTRDGDLPDDRNCMKFMMLCRSRRLNPWEGDAFLIGFKKRDTGVVEWSLVTSVIAFQKRSEIHPDYDGIESGVIVRLGADEIERKGGAEILHKKGEIFEREGDFTLTTDELLGGWSAVHFKNRKIPCKRKSRLDTYKKGFGVWLNDPAGMICKVAECQALRDSFPTVLGGMYLREEIHDVESTVTTLPERRPEFGRGLPAPEMPAEKGNGPAPAATAPARGPGRPLGSRNQPKPEPTKEPEGHPEDKQPSEPEGGFNPLKAVRGLFAEAKLNESSGLAALVDAGVIVVEDNEALPASLDEIAPALLRAISNRWQEMYAKIIEAMKAMAKAPEEPEQAAQDAAEMEAATDARPTDPLWAPKAGESEGLKAVKSLGAKAGISHHQLMSVLISRKVARDGQGIVDLAEAKLTKIAEAWANIVADARKEVPF